VEIAKAMVLSNEAIQVRFHLQEDKQKNRLVAVLLKKCSEVSSGFEPL
jgi:hypothetical protein